MRKRIINVFIMFVAIIGTVLYVVAQDIDSIPEFFPGNILKANDLNAIGDNIKYLISELILINSKVSINTDGVAQLKVDIDENITAIDKLQADTEANTADINQLQSNSIGIGISLSEVMIGNWDIQNINQESAHADSGFIQINRDGTFDLISGSFAAIGMSSGQDGSFCNHSPGSGAYEVILDNLTNFSYASGGTQYPVIPLLIELEQDKITFLGNGGCGFLGRQRVSILTRAVKD